MGLLSMEEAVLNQTGRSPVRRLLLALLLLSTLSLTAALSYPFFSQQEDTAPSVARSRLLFEVVHYIQNEYVDPDRVRPKLMLVEAGNALERKVPEIQVDFTEQSEAVQIRIGDHTESIAVQNLSNQRSSLPALLSIMRVINGLVDAYYKGDVPLDEVQYAMITGILTTLDPHTNFLPPKVFREFTVGTKGHFGGLGIVIAIRDGELTVVSPLDGTPASKLGIRPRDKIIEIEGESTVNMPLEEAVSKLRGPPRTPVNIVIMRNSWQQPRPFSIVREDIKIQSVFADLMDPHIGYIKILNFTEQTGADVARHLAKLHTDSGGLKGLILDLRNNPGGPLAQAVDVVDTFIRSGTIVTTVTGEHRDTEFAEASQTEPNYPIVVLMNEGSASGSEIVAGALQNNDRAIVVGQRSFGKGSVQSLYQLSDGSALKITIAKYLLPGDISIQALGVTPDIYLRPVSVDKDAISFFRSSSSMREADLEYYLEHRRERSDKPDLLQPEGTREIKYFEASSSVDDSSSSSDDDSAADEIYSGKLNHDKDFFSQLALRILASRSSSASRQNGLTTIDPLLSTIRKEQEKLIATALGAVGVDWSSGKGSEPTASAATMSISYSIPPLSWHAGQSVTLQLTARNTTNAPLSHIHALTRSDNSLLDEQEFILGKIPPQQQRTADVTIKIPPGVITRVDDVTFNLFSGSRSIARSYTERVSMIGDPQPLFSFGYQIIDDGTEGTSGNNDGLPQPGETLGLRVFAKNIGETLSKENLVAIRNNSGKDLFILKGRKALGELKPGGTADQLLVFRLSDDFLSDLSLSIEIADTLFRSGLSYDVTWPVAAKAAAAEPFHRAVAIEQSITLYGAASTDALPLARLESGTYLTRWKRPGWVNIMIGPSECGWIQDQSLRYVSAIGMTPPTQLQRGLQLIPVPTIDLADAKKPIQTKLDHYQLQGSVSSGTNLETVYVLANDNKVFFQSFQKSRSMMPFVASVPLRDGSNLIRVIARAEGGLETELPIVIRSDRAGTPNAKR